MRRLELIRGARSRRTSRQAAGGEAGADLGDADRVEQVVHVDLPGVAGGVAAQQVAQAVGAVDRGAGAQHGVQQLGVDVAAYGAERADAAEQPAVDEHRAAGHEVGVELGAVPAPDGDVLGGEVVELRRGADQLGPGVGTGEQQVGDEVGAVPVVVVHLQHQVAVGRGDRTGEHVAEQHRLLLRHQHHALGELRPGQLAYLAGVGVEAVRGQHQLEVGVAAACLATWRSAKASISGRLVASTTLTVGSAATRTPIRPAICRRQAPVENARNAARRSTTLCSSRARASSRSTGRREGVDDGRPEQHGHVAGDRRRRRPGTPAIARPATRTPAWSPLEAVAADPAALRRERTRASVGTWLLQPPGRRATPVPPPARRRRPRSRSG